MNTEQQTEEISNEKQMDLNEYLDILWERKFRMNCMET